LSSIRERGERGKRGKRGKRGRQGEIIPNSLLTLNS
jgi:hypothetical protein